MIYIIKPYSFVRLIELGAFYFIVISFNSIEILKTYDNGIGTMKEIARKYKINRATLYNWRYNYSKYEIDSLKESESFKRYSKEIKKMAVKDYLLGGFSQREVVNKYKISNISVLQRWTNKYNGHREIKATPKGICGCVITCYIIYCYYVSFTDKSLK